MVDHQTLAPGEAQRLGDHAELVVVAPGTLERLDQLGDLPVAAFENNACCLNANLGGLRLVAYERQEPLEQFVGVSLRLVSKLPGRDIDGALLSAPSTLARFRSTWHDLVCYFLLL